VKKDAPQLIKAAAMAALGASLELLAEWLPEGSQRGQEWVARNPTRADGRAGSFSVNLATGRWNDYADPDAHGGDLVALLAYLAGLTQLQAAQHIDQRLALGLFERGGNPAPKLEALQQASTQAHTQAKANEQERREKAAALARYIWRTSAPAEASHPYLVKKCLPALGARLNRGRLVIPLYSNRRLVNVQFIATDSSKRFLAGGQVQGAYSPIGKVQQGQPLYICEGWATGMTIYMDTRAPVACAMNAGNLEPVARFFREKLGPDFPIIIAGDDDQKTPDNPGRKGANAAALATGALVTFPQFPANTPRSLSDFSDLYLWNLNNRRIEHG